MKNSDGVASNYGPQLHKLTLILTAEIAIKIPILWTESCKDYDGTGMANADTPRWNDDLRDSKCKNVALCWLGDTLTQHHTRYANWEIRSHNTTHAMLTGRYAHVTPHTFRQLLYDYVWSKITNELAMASSRMILPPQNFAQP
jgi:hypothetical protein